MDARLEALLDRQEIADLVLRYAIALDSRDWELLRTCFAPEARVRLIGEEDFLDRDGFVERARRSLEPLDASQHFVSAPYVELDGGRAAARTYCRAQHTRRSADGHRNYMIGLTYVDELRRDAAGWRILRRELRASWTEGNPGVLGHGDDSGRRD